jgi:diphosphomevalonate decarboxylase
MNLAPYRDLKPREFRTGWRSPSNIAFVKYWGKKGHQLPANPSLSMTLKECVTESFVSFRPADDLSVNLELAGVSEPKFAEKIKNYLLSLSSDLPWLQKLNVSIQTRNTFPHGAGIASSASGLSAFALCLSEYMGEENFSERASFLARLASGSACRSVYGGFTTWGDDSDEFAISLKVHQEMQDLCDAVVIVSPKEKSVSSRAGHERMKEHAFAEARFFQAKSNYRLMKEAMMAGDFEVMGRVLENEAFSLHAMMMTSPEAFTLFQPDSIRVMAEVRRFRQETKLPIYFTLDAGPNLHLIYPAKLNVKDFIESLKLPVIYDRMGEGPVKC